MSATEQSVEERLVRVKAGSATIEGNLNLPEGARAVVLFAHGSGSSRFSSRNRYVARVLNEAKLATLLIDLLTSEEEAIDQRTAHLRFDIRLLAGRLVCRNRLAHTERRYEAPFDRLFRREHRRRCGIGSGGRAS